MTEEEKEDKKILEKIRKKYEEENQMFRYGRWKRSKDFKEK